MNLLKANIIADELIEFLKPYCSRIEKAGSIRRLKEFPGDVELCAIAEDVKKLKNNLGQWLLKNGHVDIKNVFLKSGGKYVQFMYKYEQIDLFLCQAENWGNIFAIRTGSADFSHHVLATGWVRKGYESVDGFLYRSAAYPHPVEGREKIILREEQDLFKLIGLDWVEPTDRV